MQNRPSFLRDVRLTLLLFGGKGGVGKTTTAAATALFWAKRQRKTLIVSTDPAHSLSDSFDQLIGDAITPIQGCSHLFALEINPNRLLDDFKRRYGDILKMIAYRGTYFDQDDIDQFFNLALPGLDELMAIIEIANIIGSQAYDLVIVDTAPTGHTLRLLSLPQLMEEWINVLDLMLEKHRYIAATFGRYEPDATDAFLDQMAADLRRLRAILSDSHTTEFVPVAIPEAMSIEETTRLLTGLAEHQINVQTIVVNRVVLARDCPFCTARHAMQAPHLHEIEQRFAQRTIVQVPLFGHEIRGQEALEKYIRAVQGNWDLATESDTNVSGESNAVHLAPVVQFDLRALQHLKLLLFGGKGGVGKTSMAAATALHLARTHPEHKTLIFSTDPAHSLTDSFEQQIGSQITSIDGFEGLFALEMDSLDLLEDLKRAYVAEIDEVFDSFFSGSFDVPFDRRVMEELISLTPAGLDEFMALIKIMDFMEEGRYNRYILDLAPTGHALRFLEMPDVVRQWFTTFFKLLLKYYEVTRLTRMSDLLRQKSKQLRQVQKILHDAERCQFVAVTIPEAMAVEETRRLLQRLAELEITCGGGVVNMAAMPSASQFCTGLRSGQQRYVEELRQLHANMALAPFFTEEIRGVDQLSRMADTIYGAMPTLP